jgi:hypothetical protein
MSGPPEKGLAGLLAARVSERAVKRFRQLCHAAGGRSSLDGPSGGPRTSAPWPTFGLSQCCGSDEGTGWVGVESLNSQAVKPVRVSLAHN